MPGQDTGVEGNPDFNGPVIIQNNKTQSMLQPFT